MNEETQRPPDMTRHEGRDESIKDNSGTIARGGDATIHDRTGLYISILALALAGIALGLWLNQSQIIEAKVQAGIAKAEATAHAADTNSRVALDKFDELRVKLAEKGIKVTLD